MATEPKRTDRSNLRQLQKRRNSADQKKRDEGKGYSLENLKLTNLLNQLQALQAVQGLQELRPKGKGKKYRFEIPRDEKERASMRRWLMFKADWLEALLEDALDELEALQGYDDGINEARKYTRKTIKISASYELTLEDNRTEYRACHMQDISIGGVRLLLEEKVSINTPLKVNLQDGTVLDGVVVWSKETEDDKRHYNTGVTFKDIEALPMDKIEHLIEDQSEEDVK